MASSLLEQLSSALTANPEVKNPPSARVAAEQQAQIRQWLLEGAAQIEGESPEMADVAREFAQGIAEGDPDITRQATRWYLANQGPRGGDILSGGVPVEEQGLGLMGMNYNPPGQTVEGGNMGYPRTGEAREAQQRADRYGATAVTMMAPGLLTWLSQGLPARTLRRMPVLGRLIPRNFVPKASTYRARAAKPGVLGSLVNAATGARPNRSWTGPPTASNFLRDIVQKTGSTFRDLSAIPGVMSAMARIEEAELAGDPDLKMIAALEFALELAGTKTAQHVVGRTLGLGRRGERLLNAPETEQPAGVPLGGEQQIVGAPPINTRGVELEVETPDVPVSPDPPTGTRFEAGAPIIPIEQADSTAAAQRGTTSIEQEGDLFSGRVRPEPATTPFVPQRPPVNPAARQQGGDFQRPAEQPPSRQTQLPETGELQLTAEQRTAAESIELELIQRGVPEEDAIVLSRSAATDDPEALAQVIDVLKREPSTSPTATPTPQGAAVTRRTTRPPETPGPEDDVTAATARARAQAATRTQAIVNPAGQKTINDTIEAQLRQRAEALNKNKGQVTRDIDRTNRYIDPVTRQPRAGISEQQAKRALNAYQRLRAIYTEAAPAADTATATAQTGRRVPREQTIEDAVDPAFRETDPNLEEFLAWDDAPLPGSPVKPATGVQPVDRGTPLTPETPVVTGSQVVQREPDVPLRDQGDVPVIADKAALRAEIREAGVTVKTANFNRLWELLENNDPEALKWVENLRAVEPPPPAGSSGAVTEGADASMLHPGGARPQVAVNFPDAMPGDKRTAAGKDLWARFTAAAEGMTKREITRMWRNARTSPAGYRELQQVITKAETALPGSAERIARGGVQPGRGEGGLPAAGLGEVSPGATGPYGQTTGTSEFVSPENVQRQRDIAAARAVEGREPEIESVTPGAELKTSGRDLTAAPTTAFVGPRQIPTTSPAGRIDLTGGSRGETSTALRDPETDELTPIGARILDTYSAGAENEIAQVIQRMRTANDPAAVKKAITDFHLAQRKNLLESNLQTEADYKRWQTQTIRSRHTNIDLLARAKQAVQDQFRHRLTGIFEQPEGQQAKTYYRKESVEPRQSGVASSLEKAYGGKGVDPNDPRKVYAQNLFNVFFEEQDILNKAGDVVATVPKHPVVQHLYRMEFTRMQAKEKAMFLEAAFKDKVAPDVWQSFTRHLDKLDELQAHLDTEVDNFLQVSVLAPRADPTTGGYTYSAGTRPGEVRSMPSTLGTGYLGAPATSRMDAPVQREGQARSPYKIQERRDTQHASRVLPSDLADARARILAYTREITNLNADISKATDGLFSIYSMVDPTLWRNFVRHPDALRIAGGVTGGGIGWQAGVEGAKEEGEGTFGRMINGALGATLYGVLGYKTKDIYKGAMKGGDPRFGRMWSERLRDGLLLNMLSSPSSPAKAFLGAHAGFQIEGLSRQIQGALMKFDAGRLRAGGDTARAADLQKEGDLLTEQGRGINSDMFRLEVDFMSGNPNNMIREIYRIDPETREGRRELERYVERSGWNEGVDAALAVERMSGMMSGNMLGRAFRASDWAPVTIGLKHGVSLEEGRRLALTGTPETETATAAMKWFSGTQAQQLRMQQTAIAQRAQAQGITVDTPEDVAKLMQHPDFGPELEKIQSQLTKAGWGDFVKTLIAPMARVGVQMGEQAARWGAAPLVRGAEALLGKRLNLPGFLGRDLETLAPVDKPYQTAARGAMAAGLGGIGAGTMLYGDPRIQNLAQAGGGHLAGPQAFGQSAGQAYAEGGNVPESLAAGASSLLQEISPVAGDLVSGENVGTTFGKYAISNLHRTLLQGIGGVPGGTDLSSRGAAQGVASGDLPPVFTAPHGIGATARTFAPLTQYAARFPARSLAPSPITGKPTLDPRITPFNLFNNPFTEGIRRQPVSPTERPMHEEDHAGSYTPVGDATLNPNPNPLFRIPKTLYNIGQTMFARPNEQTNRVTMGRDEVAQILAGQGNTFEGEQIVGAPTSGRVVPPSRIVDSTWDRQEGHPLKGVPRRVEDFAQMSRGMDRSAQYFAIRDHKERHPETWASAMQDPTGNALRQLIADVLQGLEGTEVNPLGTDDVIKSLRNDQLLETIARQRGATTANPDILRPIR